MLPFFKYQQQHQASPAFTCKIGHNLKPLQTLQDDGLYTDTASSLSCSLQESGATYLKSVLRNLKDQYQLNLFHNNKTCHDRLPSFNNILKLKKYFAGQVWTSNKFYLCTCTFNPHPQATTTSHKGSRQGDLADLELGIGMST
jgi:hypothetical protein